VHAEGHECPRRTLHAGSGLATALGRHRSGRQGAPDAPSAGWQVLNPRGIIFDFGGVLWNMRWDVARGLDQAHGLPRSSVFDTLYRSDTWREIECGRGDRQAWLEKAHRALEARAGRPLPRLHDEWRRAQGPIEANLTLVRELGASHKLGVLSNADRSLR